MKHLAVEAHVVDRIANAPIETAPFPHVYLENIFPADFYAEMRRQIPVRDVYKRISETGRTSGDYERRLILHLKQLEALPAEQRRFWRDCAAWLLGSKLASALIRKFRDSLSAAIDKDLRALDYGVEGMLVKDLDGYRIGPHTDVTSRAVSIMFYLPPDDRNERHGTSLYRPRDPALRSDGNLHFEFAPFEKVKTVPYRVNAMFGFPRSDASFHGVEPIGQPGIERDVLLYILRWQA
jgi:hypothetical protein